MAKFDPGEGIEEVNEKKEESKKRDKEIEEEIQTNKVYIRDNGNLRKAKIEDKKRLKDIRTFRFKCLEDWAFLYDFDVTDARPFLKDLLNRQWQFLEVKLLYWLLAVWVWSLLAIFWIFTIVPSTSDFTKTIQDSIKTLQTTKIQQAIPDRVQVIDGSGTQPVEHKNIREILLNQ